MHMLMRHGQGDAWHEPEVGDYPSEEDLEALLAESPELLPWGSGQDLVVARQVGLPVGTVDLVGVSLDGEIVLIECKLRSNPEIRRHVVGQVLAYAGAAWEMSYGAFSQAFGKGHGKWRGKSLEDAAHSAAHALSTTWDGNVFCEAVEANLSKGRFRLLLAVDVLTEELRRIVEFINAHTGPDLQVLAIELQYCKDGDMEILLSRVYGEEDIQRAAGKARTHLFAQPHVMQRFMDALEELMTESSNFQHDMA